MNTTTINWLAELQVQDAGREKSLVIVSAIREAICNGTLKPGDKLPSARTLASALGVSRGCIHRALQGLVGCGLVEDASEYKVTRRAERPLESHAGNSVNVRISDYAARLFEHQPQQRVSSRSSGRPPEDLLPRHIWKALSNGQTEPTVVGESAACGWMPLRKAYANYLKRSRGMLCEPEQVIVFHARELRIPVIAHCLISSGDAVAMENPGFPSARLEFDSVGARVLTIPVDERGLRVEQLSALDEPVKLIYVTPAHQQPTGVVLSPTRRLGLLEWARANEAIILEDDYDHEFRYPARRLPALASDSNDHVIHMSCLWKILSPVCTMGFLVLPPSLISRITAAKAIIEPEVPLSQQAALAKFINDGHLEWHIRKTKTVLLRRREAVVTALKRWFGERIIISPETGGTDLLFRCLTTQSDEGFLTAAVRCGLPVNSTQAFYADQSPGSEFVLSFSHVHERDADSRIKALAAAVF